MAVFTCEKCGNKVDTRCKPEKCPACSESGTMVQARSADGSQAGQEVTPAKDNRLRRFLISLSLEG